MPPKRWLPIGKVGRVKTNKPKGRLKKRTESRGKLGAVGFCLGGGIVNQFAVRRGSDLNAGVAYYGRQPGAADVPKITAPLMLHYAGADTRVNYGIPAYEAALKPKEKKYEIFTYEGKQHGFRGRQHPPARP